MPIYEYACSACEHEFETLQGFSEDPLRFCPECGKEALHKNITAAAFHLKGTGWYETDFKGKKKTDESGDDAGTGDAKKDDGKDAKADKSESSTKSTTEKSSESSDSGKSKKNKKGKKASSKGKGSSGGSRQSAA